MFVKRSLGRPPARLPPSKRARQVLSFVPATRSGEGGRCMNFGVELGKICNARGHWLWVKRRSIRGIVAILSRISRFPRPRLRRNSLICTCLDLRGPLLSNLRSTQFNYGCLLRGVLRKRCLGGEVFVDAYLHHRPAISLHLACAPRNNRFGCLGVGRKAAQGGIVCFHAQSHAFDPELTHLVVATKHNLFPQVRVLGQGPSEMARREEYRSHQSQAYQRTARAQLLLRSCGAGG